MPVLLRFHPVVFGRETETGHVEEATVLPRNRPVLFRTPVSLGCLNKTPLKLPGDRRFNTVYSVSMRCLPTSLRCGPGLSRCLHRSDAQAENREIVSEALLEKKCLFLTLIQE